MCQWSFYAAWIWWRYIWQGSFPAEFVSTGRNFGTFLHETWNWAITKHTFATLIFVICIKLYGLAPVQKNPSKFLRIDKYWSKVGKISYESGNRSSHNSAPERGFSINKILLDAHGTSMGENAISALPFGRLAFFYMFPYLAIRFVIMRLLVFGLSHFSRSWNFLKNVNF